MAGIAYGSFADSLASFRDGSGQLGYQLVGVGSNGALAIQAPYSVGFDPDTGLRFGTLNPQPIQNPPIAPQTSTALASSQVFNASSGAPGPCALLALQVNAVGQRGWLLLYDALAAPADGAVLPKKFWQIPANTTLDWRGYPIKLLVGCVMVFSTDGPFTQTSAVAATFSAEVS